jgi:hypothetical protein
MARFIQLLRETQEAKREPRIHHSRNTVSIEALGAMIPGRAACKATQVGSLTEKW